MTNDGKPPFSPAASKLAARLVHDVGKYIARTARNVPEGAWTPDLAVMLCRDLFELPGGRASAVFEKAAKTIEELLGPQPALAHVRTLLARIDALEASARQGEPTALEEASPLALAVDKAVRDFSYSLREGTS